jgi:hypothetical protein
VKKFIFFILSGLMLFLFSFKPQLSIVRNFDIHIAGIKVGYLTATRQISGDLIIYNLYSDVSVYLMHRYRVKDEVNSIYKNNILQSATVKTSVGNKNYFSTIKWNKDHYDIDITGYHYSKQGIETLPIEYSVARIYIEEPPISAKVFSEDYGIFSNIDELELHKNQIIFLGKKDKFTYVNGELFIADMQSTVRDFIIKSR